MRKINKELYKNMEVRTHFHNELNRVFRDVITMGDMVRDLLNKGLDSLLNANEILAREVIEEDQKIDDMQMKIEDECTLIIAKETPVATELREVLTVIKIANELERLGDHAKHMAKRAGKVSTEGLKIAGPTLKEMNDFGIQMVKEALESFLELDSSWAREIAERDNFIDQKYYALYDKLINIIKEKPYKAENLVPLLFLNRYLERIGDRVTNICECIVYSKTNKHVELN
ncbi:MAG: phosphate signaling complex protein PhoU [Spirochaetales bacterium]|nr:phosphate signaling complex protein PhoU [Spirochaetales bacterium]